MPGSIVSRHWMPCVFKKHMPLDLRVIKEIEDIFQTLELFDMVDKTGLEDVWTMIVADTHFPCTYEKNGTSRDIITTVKEALRLCQVKNNACIHKLNSVIQYFHNINRADILDMQIIYSQ